MYILDSSAFIRDHRKEGKIATVAEVSEELVGEASLRFEAMRGEECRYKYLRKGLLKK